MADAGSDFYLGKKYDLASGKVLEEQLLYDPADLTTHAFVTGMTGSGKTGLCVGLLEEAALKGIPAIMVDPKGDLTNLLLHFPQLLPSDFEPWIDPNEARRQGKDVATMAAETAETWRNGLAGSGLGPEQIQRLADSVEFNLFTPGSGVGESVNILSSFNSTDLNWNENQELLRDKISSTVTALLGLIGYKDLDPLRSREHILISNILEQSWSQGKSIDMINLIMQVQKPPMERLGAFPLDSFYPEKDRFDLAMLLNNFLASPSFQVWIQGTNLDVQSFLYTKDGKPRHSIFYLAHLSDTERMFFVTLLYSAIETWMFTQRGTSTLRALVYFDEVHGYLPPVANPPSKVLFLRLLKQARAFGVGLILATQNPVDVDYKALSNAGTWMIGRLQTEQDKQRLLDGLSEVAGGASRANYDKMISTLGKRVFLMHNVHDKGPSVFTTRFVMNYLAGPLTKSQIPELMKLADNGKTRQTTQAEAADDQSTRPIKVAAATASQEASDYLTTKPVPPSSIPEFFYPVELDAQTAFKGQGVQGLESTRIVYHPQLVGQAEIRYYSRPLNLDFSKKSTVLVDDLQDRSVRWEDFVWSEVDQRQLNRGALPQSIFAQLPIWLSDAKRLSSMQSDFMDWLYRTGIARVKANKTLKVYADPNLSDAEFEKAMAAAAKTQRDAEEAKVLGAIDKKLTALDQKIRRQELEVEQQEKEYNQRKMEEMGAGGELLLSLFTKRKKSISSNLTKRRMTSNAKSDLEQENEELKGLQAQREELLQQKQTETEALKEKWDAVTGEIEEVALNPAKKDIYLELYGVLWVPYYQVGSGFAAREAPAFNR